MGERTGSRGLQWVWSYVAGSVTKSNMYSQMLSLCSHLCWSNFDRQDVLNSALSYVMTNYLRSCYKLGLKISLFLCLY
ncbi:hypothetical protein CCHR01_16225 [Colletotrichum chrysophilum]|uniref:Uncharacterized protein n=1 Tax=Colletotrichum chrysophilum TaxID=1836956 RepID=A0AAD9A684_9PEZI|nr:hypothetical protein CCHR01_16225 [Colletotrichum chrysophilum]